jgi:hypothetical protein
MKGCFKTLFCQMAIFTEIVRLPWGFRLKRCHLHQKIAFNNFGPTKGFN